MPRMDCTLLGRKLGTASGWDGDPECFWYEDFQPHNGVDLPSGDLLFDLVKGRCGITDDDGEIIHPQDICAALISIPIEA